MKKYLKLAPLLGSLLGIIAIFLFFAPFASISSTTEIGSSITGNISGFVAAFGGKYNVTKINSSIDIISLTTTYSLNLAVTPLLCFIFIVIGVAGGIIVAFVKNLPGKRIVALVCGIFFLIGGIFAFTSLSSLISSNADSDYINTIYLKLGAGAIVTGVLAILGGLCVSLKALDKE